MGRIAFSPVEEGVLALLGERWWTLEELQEYLFDEWPPTAVAAALAYLRRQRLAQALERRYGVPYFESTELGKRVLAEHRRGQRGVLHAV